MEIDDYIEAFQLPDVPPDQWAFDEIHACVNAGLVARYPNGKFSPDRDVSRAQIAVCLAKASELVN